MTTTEERLVASYLKRDSTPDPVVMAVSRAGVDIATTVVPERYQGFEEPDVALAELGYRRLGLWRHTARAASVDVEPVREG